jgi:hypothetical protein
MISQSGLVKKHMCKYWNAAAINTRNIFKHFGLTIVPIMFSRLEVHPCNAGITSPAPVFLHSFAQEDLLILQYSPEIIIDTCMSENVLHYNLNIRVMTYDTDFYYKTTVCTRRVRKVNIHHV